MMYLIINGTMMINYIKFNLNMFAVYMKFRNQFKFILKIKFIK